jgi:hypothetical protein
MTIVLSGAFVIGGLVVWGFMASRKQRGIDRRHFAAFVGFSAAVVAVAATTLELVVADLQPHSMDPVLGGVGVRNRRHCNCLYRRHLFSQARSVWELNALHSSVVESWSL